MRAAAIDAAFVAASAWWFAALAIIAATFVSEDLTCITVGLLIRRGQIDPWLGVGACFVGIFVGDLGLWLIGRLAGRGMLRWRWLRGRLGDERLRRLGSWFDRHGWAGVLAARFVPGTRFPVYVGAGMLGRRARRFVLVALLAAALWTPLLILVVAALGEPVVGALERVLGEGWHVLALAVLLVFLAERGVTLAFSEVARARLAARVARIWRWEFWPPWLFYLPLVPWVAWLAVRHRGLTTFTAANPGIPAGGVVGESKHAILEQLPARWVAPSVLLRADDPAGRGAALHSHMEAAGWRYPLILKPDAGQRGAGVRLVRDEAAAQRYLAESSYDVLAQVFHRGPFEAGVFYYRFPHEPTGRILSITDKCFATLIGDGRTTVERLIWRHPRYRMQASTFLARLNGQAERVLAAGETLPLVVAGNHCQGTLFRDGAHLSTPQLERRIDEIARQFDGFFFGRFDVRYADPAALRAGEDFAIIELNGVTSESTNLYDPSWPLWRAYQMLYRQWGLMFEIGAANRARGHAALGARELLRLIRSYYRAPRPGEMSD